MATDPDLARAVHYVLAEIRERASRPERPTIGECLDFAVPGGEANPLYNACLGYLIEAWLDAEPDDEEQNGWALDIAIDRAFNDAQDEED